MLWEEKSIICFQEGGHFGFSKGQCVVHHMFQPNSPCYLRDVKTGFQDGCCGSPPEFPIDTILAYFNPEVILLLLNKFLLKLNKGLDRDVEN